MRLLSLNTRTNTRKVPPPLRNIYSHHRWQVTGGYDATVDGAHPRKQITCKRCGEVRRVGCALDDPRLGGGCRRFWWPRRYIRGDLVVRGDALDQFIMYTNYGRALTWNAGGHGHISAISDLKPYQP